VFLHRLNEIHLFAVLGFQERIPVPIAKIESPGRLSAAGRPRIIADAFQVEIDASADQISIIDRSGYSDATRSPRMGVAQRECETLYFIGRQRFVLVVDNCVMARSTSAFQAPLALEVEVGVRTRSICDALINDQPGFTISCSVAIAWHRKEADVVPFSHDNQCQ